MKKLLSKTFSFLVGLIIAAGCFSFAGCNQTPPEFFVKDLTIEVGKTACFEYDLDADIFSFEIVEGADVVAQKEGKICGVKIGVAKIKHTATFADNSAVTCESKVFVIEKTGTLGDTNPGQTPDAPNQEENPDNPPATTDPSDEENQPGTDNQGNENQGGEDPGTDNPNNPEESNPGEDNQPEQPEQPENPDTPPVDQKDPVDPTPVDPENPSNPENPTDPTEPENPDQPDNPTEPTDPDDDNKGDQNDNEQDPGKEEQTVVFEITKAVVNCVLNGENGLTITKANRFACCQFILTNGEKENLVFVCEDGLQTQLDRLNDLPALRITATKTSFTGHIQVLYDNILIATLEVVVP